MINSGSLPDNKGWLTCMMLCPRDILDINIIANENLKLRETFHMCGRRDDFPIHFKAYLNSFEYESQYMYLFLVMRHTSIL